METMDDSRKSIRSLAESIHSLLGLKTHLTSSWVDSVCNMIKSSPSDELQPVLLDLDYNNDHDNNDNGNLGIAILKIKDELAALTANINQLNIQRRQVLNDFLDLKGNIRVFCHVRPPITMGENFSHLRPGVVALDSSSTVLLNFTDNKSKIYSFDKVFHPGSSQDEIFLQVEPVIKSALDGYNACIFAYGQTGTGKTHTMEGNADRPGVIPHAIEALFKQAADSNHTFLFSFSMLEIYMGYLKDLPVPPQTTKATDRMPLSPSLSIRTDSKGEVEIDNLVTIQVSDFNQAKRLYKLGCHFRSTASTNSNKSSSRSHSMIRILMTCSDATERRRIKNKIWMVDLGGSERVLKTRAWGRRFEEGKAINLSLSALGDVINALQRKKCHIPYRNSKLTQVLKDSLGEALMLVHVSPKEEDLCETVCSLNFATRVRSTHLGNEESTEAKVQKEVEMTSLQQKMKWIEDKRHKARREINTLNEKLEDLTRIPPSSIKKLEDSHQSFELEVPQSNVEIGKKTGNVTAAPSSALPKFMRSTICSRRKSGIDHQTSEETDPVPVRRRRLSSYHAKSVALPIMGMSEYNSESSISRTSCLVGSKLKCNSDNETEGSQVKSEFDIKKVIFPIQDKSPRSSNHKKAHLSCNKGHGNRKMHQFNFPKFINVDNWFNLHKNAYGTSSYTHWNKRVLAIPKPEKNSKGNQQRLLEQLHDEKVYNYKVSKKKIKHDELNRPTEGAAGRPRSKEVADIMPTVFKDFSNEDSTSNSISPTHTTDGKLMIQTQGTVDDVSIEEYICSTSTPPDTWCGVFNKKEGETGVNRMAMEQITYETPSLEALMLKNSWASIHSASDGSGSITALIGDFGVSISRSELKSPHQKVPTEIGKNSEEEEAHVSSHYSKAGKLQHQNLLVDKANQVHLAMSIFQSQGKTKSTAALTDKSSSDIKRASVYISQQHVDRAGTQTEPLRNLNVMILYPRERDENPHESNKSCMHTCECLGGGDIQPHITSMLATVTIY